MTDIFLGILVLAVALTCISMPVGLEKAVAFAVVLICGGTIIYSFSLILATLSFRFTFITTVPALALTGKLTTEALTLDLGLAVVMLVVSRLFCRIGLRNYSGVSN